MIVEVQAWFAPTEENFNFDPLLWLKTPYFRDDKSIYKNQVPKDLLLMEILKFFSLSSSAKLGCMHLHQS